jgi:hypothetical protein
MKSRESSGRTSEEEEEENEDEETPNHQEGEQSEKEEQSCTDKLPSVTQEETSEASGNDTDRNDNEVVNSMNSSKKPMLEKVKENCDGIESSRSAERDPLSIPPDNKSEENDDDENSSSSASSSGDSSTSSSSSSSSDSSDSSNSDDSSSTSSKIESKPPNVVHLKPTPLQRKSVKKSSRRKPLLDPNATFTFPEANTNRRLSYGSTS